MDIFSKSLLWSIIFGLLGSTCLFGWWLYAFFFLPVALAGLSAAMVLLVYRETQSQSVIWIMIPVVCLLVGLLTVTAPNYDQQRLMSRDVEDCVVGGGSISSCLKEAKTLRGYDVRPYVTYVDWQRAMKGCLAQSGARACVEDFVKNRVAEEAGMSSVEVASVCVGADDRTDCLLALAYDGFPFREIGVVDDGAP